MMKKHSNLYVKNISDRIDELMLRELFEACGDVRSCCVIRDVSTNRSRGFGFVKFADVDKATEAIARFHGKEYAGKVLEVKFANTDGESDDANLTSNAPPSDNVYVKGLPPNWTHDDLKVYFSQFGHIIECRLLHANKSTSSGALIRFLSDTEATAAVTRGNGRMLVGVATPLVVRYAEPQGKGKRAQSSPGAQDSIVPPLVRREDSARDEAAFNDMFKSIGLKSISSNSGFAELLGVFQDDEDVAAFAALGSSPSRFDGPQHENQNQAPLTKHMQPVLAHTMTNVNSSIPSGFLAQQQPVTRPQFFAACVQNLPITANELTLYQLFAPHGAIISTQILRDEWTGLCSGVGAVNFRSESEAIAAQRALHMKNVGQNIITVTVRSSH